MVTISDVATQAGVSIKTVSRVINEEPHVRDTVREKVQTAIEVLGYVPNVSARRLASSRSFLMTMLYDNPNSGYVMSIMRGAMDACRSLGYNLLVESLDAKSPELNKEICEILRRSGSDGIILTPPFSDDTDLIRALEQDKRHVITISARLPYDGVQNILINEEKAGYDMTRYLLGLGHRRVAFIKGAKGHSASALRFRGYETAMSEAGIATDDGLIKSGEFSYRKAMQCTEELLQLEDRPTAVFACNDDMAAAVLAVAQMRQISVPDDLAIAGFDDTPIALTVWPALTTIRQPFHEMAGEAARLLAAQIKKKAPYQDKIQYMDYELIVRESTSSMPIPHDEAG